MIKPRHLYFFTLACFLASNFFEKPAMAQNKGDVCETSECVPLPKEFQAFFHDRVEGEEFVVLKLPPKNTELTTLKRVPKDLKITYRNKSGGRAGGEYAVEIDAKGKATVKKSSRTEYQTGSKKIASKQLLKLLHQLGEIGFMDITSESLTESCKGHMTHAATLTFTVSFGDHSNSITYYEGCNPGRKSDTQLALKAVSEAVYDLTKGAKLGEAKSLYPDAVHLE